MISGFRNYYSDLVSDMDVEDLGKEISILINIEEHIPYWRETSLSKQISEMKDCLVDETFSRFINGTVNKITR